eukprot:68341-Chlamydomonas_euryale.AAC.7
MRFTNESLKNGSLIKSLKDGSLKTTEWEGRMGVWRASLLHLPTPVAHIPHPHTTPNPVSTLPHSDLPFLPRPIQLTSCRCTS